MSKTAKEIALEQRIAELEAELKVLQQQQFHSEEPTVKYFDEVAPMFIEAQRVVGEYFSKLRVNPAEASIDIEGERFLLLRASAISVDFFKTLARLYADKGEEEAFRIGQSFLFDISHALGIEDAKNFHDKTQMKDPLLKMSAGPVYFAY